MNPTHDFLFEIGTEEMPARMIAPLAKSLRDNMQKTCQENGLTVEHIDYFGTPRRLAIYIKGLSTQQPDQTLEKRGCALSAAFDSDGKPTPAALGFAKSCHTTLDHIDKIKTDKGEYLFFKQTVAGKLTKNLLPELLKTAIDKLPLQKPMRWGNNDYTFIRPVKWLTALLDEAVLPFSLFGLTATNKTYGHRFHHPEALTLKKPSDYETILETKGFVIPSLEKRQQSIVKQIKTVTQNKGTPIIDEALLTEVTGLVEYPVVLLGTFDKSFLALPKEVIITTLKSHQKCFTVTDATGDLLPYFIITSNIDSIDPEHVKQANGKVIKARLSDATFFYQTDLKTDFAVWQEKLKTIVFQQKLGTLADKTTRITKLSQTIATHMQADIEKVTQAAYLAKVDLISAMVGEFPNLQGTIGRYYALEKGIDPDIATAIESHYLPRSANDVIPQDRIGITLGIADRLDTLVGIFGINQAPTGVKDPFGLRRAALAILRLLINNTLNLDLDWLINQSLQTYDAQLSVEKSALNTQLLTFFMERLKAWHLEQGTPPAIFQAVAAMHITNPNDFNQRLHALTAFTLQNEAQILAAMNKRVGNILKKNPITTHHKTVDPSLFKEAIEKDLWEKITAKQKITAAHHAKKDYEALLLSLCDLADPMNHYFDTVLVMADDKTLRDNRLCFLQELRHLFTQVADISYL